MFTKENKGPALPRKRANIPQFNTSAIVQVMIDAAYIASRGLLKDFNEVENLQVSLKGPADFVSKADINADKKLREILNESRPSFGFLTEEMGEDKGTEDARWIIDPLDGTTNFLHGLPHWAISIGLEMNGEITAAVIYDPCKNEFFHAEKGRGAFVNQKRLRVSGRKDLSTCIFATGIPFKGQREGYRDEFTRQLQGPMIHTAGVRRFGSAALDLAYVAAGRYDGYWESGLNPWDVAAGWLMIREAGGTIKQLDGQDFSLSSPTILATNAEIYTQALKLFKEV